MGKAELIRQLQVKAKLAEDTYGMTESIFHLAATALAAADKRVEEAYENSAKVAENYAVGYQPEFNHLAATIRALKGEPRD